MPEARSGQGWTRRRPRGSRAALWLLAGALLACGPADPLEAIRELQTQERFEESLAPLQELIASRTGDPEVHYRYGVALARTGRPDMAVWTLREASTHPDWVVRAGLALATAAVQSGSWDVAIEAAGRVLEQDPEEVSALILRAQARLQQKRDLEGALADYDRALARQPDNLGLHSERAAALLALGRVDEAGDVIAELEARAREGGREVDDATLGHLCVTRATFASERRAFEEAEQLFADCLVRFPTHRTVLDQALDFFDQRGSQERATEILAAALERVPQALLYRDRLARRLRAAGDFKQSERVLRAGLELEEPGLAAGTWTSLADHFVALGDLDSAAGAYEQSLALDPDPSTKQQLALADVLARAGQNERALEVARRLDNPAYRALVEARVHLNRQQPARALERLDEVFRIWPNNPGARYYAARAAEQLGDFDRAIEEYRQSIRSRPEFTDAGLRLAKLYAAQGAGEHAWTAAGHYRRSHPGDPEATLYLVRLAQRFGPASRLRGLLAGLRQGPLWGQVAALRADQLAERGEPEAALALLQGKPELDLTRPRNAAALRSLCDQLLALGRPAEARQAAQAALAAHPELAAFHEIYGRVLEAQPGSAPQAGDAYRRALELDPLQFEAPQALARLAAQAGDVEAALAYYDRAAAARPGDPIPLQRAASLAAQSGRSQEAEERWEALLREHPWAAEAALELARLRQARGADAGRTLELAERARRFGGGEEAEQLRDRVLRELEAAGQRAS